MLYTYLCNDMTIYGMLVYIVQHDFLQVTIKYALLEILSKTTCTGLDRGTHGGHILFLYSLDISILFKGIKT